MKRRIKDFQQRDISYGELVALQQEFETQLDENGVIFDDDESYDEALGDFIQQYMEGDDNPMIDLSTANVRPVRDSKRRQVRDASARGVKLPTSNLYFYGSKMDINGNSCAVFSFGANGRKWSVQTEAFDEFRKLRIRGNESVDEIIKWIPEEQIEQAAIDYINNFGSPRLKDQLYIYDSRRPDRDSKRRVRDDYKRGKHGEMLYTSNDMKSEYTVYSDYEELETLDNEAAAVEYAKQIFKETGEYTYVNMSKCVWTSEDEE